MDQETRIDAYVDGELSPGQLAAFEAELARDDALAQAVERRMRLTARLGEAYGLASDEPMPAQVRALLSAANDPAPPRRARFGPAAWAAMAACLIGGVLAGRFAEMDPAPVRLEAGHLTARGDLARGLEGSLASESGSVRVGLSFRTAEGDYCRTFTSERARLAGLACKQDGRWIAQTLTAWRGQGAREYRTAGAEIPPEVLAAVDALASGAPLNQAAERAARDRGWAD